MEGAWEDEYFIAHTPNGTRRSSAEDASSTHNTSKPEDQQTMVKRERKCLPPQSLDVPAHGHHYLTAVGPVKRHVHHGQRACLCA